MSEVASTQALQVSSSHDGVVFFFKASRSSHVESFIAGLSRRVTSPLQLPHGEFLPCSSESNLFLTGWNRFLFHGESLFAGGVLSRRSESSSLERSNPSSRRVSFSPLGLLKIRFDNGTERMVRLEQEEYR